LINPTLAPAVSQFEIQTTKLPEHLPWIATSVARSGLKRGTVHSDPKRGRAMTDPSIPLSTAENCVFVSKIAAVGVENLIVTSLLSPFRPRRPTAEIGRFCDGWQRAGRGTQEHVQELLNSAYFDRENSTERVYGR
jgi:hypothetical protein